MNDSAGTVAIRLVFVDSGSYHDEQIEIPFGLLDQYDRLIDLLREEPSVLQRIYLDLDRLCAAQVVEED